MLKITIALLLLVSSSAFAENWTTSDTKREAVYLALHAVDWAQTRNIARNPDKWYEQNPILGKHPSVGRVDAYFALTGLAHYFIADALPAEYRKVFQYISIVHDAGYVAHNYSLGVKFRF